MPIARMPTPLRKLTKSQEAASTTGATVRQVDRTGRRPEELARGKYYLTFPPSLEHQSVICDMYDQLGIKFSIRQAHVSDEMAVLGVELLGVAAQLRVAEEYLASRGVRVEAVNVAPAE